MAGRSVAQLCPLPHSADDLDDISALAAELRETEGFDYDTALIRALEIYDELAERAADWDADAAAAATNALH